MDLTPMYVEAGATKVFLPSLLMAPESFVLHLTRFQSFGLGALPRLLGRVCAVGPSVCLPTLLAASVSH